MPLDPVTGALIGGVAGTTLSSVLGRKRRPKLPDYQPAINEINNSAAKNAGLANALPGNLAPLSSQFKTDTSNLANSLVSGTQARTNQYTSDYSNAANQLGESLSDIARRRTFENQPALLQQTRENLAASGQLRSGRGAQALNAVPVELSRQLAEQNANIGTQQLQARQQAIRDAFQTNQDAGLKAIGLNQDALTRLFASGREDLIREAEQLMGIESGRSGAIAGIRGQQAENQFASDLAKNEAFQQTLGTLLGGLGQFAGYKAGQGGAPGAAPAAGGSSLNLGSPSGNMNDQLTLARLLAAKRGY